MHPHAQMGFQTIVSLHGRKETAGDRMNSHLPSAWISIYSQLHTSSPSIYSQALCSAGIAETLHTSPTPRSRYNILKPFAVQHFCRHCFYRHFTPPAPRYNILKPCALQASLRHFMCTSGDRRRDMAPLQVSWTVGTPSGIRGRTE